MPAGTIFTNDISIGAILFLGAFALGLGVFWYELLPAHMPDRWWRIMVYPLIAIVFGEALIPYGAAFAGFHPVTAIFASLVGVLVDWAITEARRPVIVAEPMGVRPTTTVHAEPVR